MLPQPPENTAAGDGVWPSGRHRGRRRAPSRAPSRGPARTHRTGAIRTGAHRHPGTLPIESWLLLGRHKQQAMLASLVAVGLFLVMIPTTQRGSADLDPVSAAQRQAQAAAAAANGGSGVTPITAPTRRTKPAQRDDAPDASTETDTPPTRAVPATPAPPAGSATPPAGATDAGAPPGAPESTGTATPTRRGTGPADSVRRTTTGTVALTFDDGPDPVQTPKMLDLLKSNGVTATFCLVGVQVRAHPELVRRIAAEGHALCNHSWDHSFTLGKQKPSQIRDDLGRTNDAIRAAVPGAEIPYFRAPGGNFTDRLVTAADSFAMTSLYWEVDPRDWDQPTEESDSEHVERVVDLVEKDVRKGSIVLSHDFKQSNTVEAYAILLPRLTARFELGLP
jgi:peptidoglycan/xylan/chitin deacetylase (PgdA/CDA1 family)